jgi:hypothetical protein
MSDSINSAKRATAGITRHHSRFSILAASAATVGVLGAAGFAVGSAPWSAAAGDAVKTGSAPGHSAAFDVATGAKAQLDSAHNAGGSTVDATAAGVSSHYTRHAAKPAVDKAAKSAPAKAAPAKHAEKAAPAKHEAKRAAKKAPAKRKHYQYPIYDSVTPGNLPHGKVAAVYTNGAYAASAAQVAGHKSVLWIDTNGSNPGATVLDVEPGDATPHGAAVWVQQRLAKHPHSVAIVYTMRSAWQDVKDNVAHLPKWQQDKVRYWIADPTGVQHMVPGADATQWYWGANIDVSVANESLTVG